MIIIIMGFYCRHFTTIYKQAANKPTTLDTSSLSAQQLNTGWIFPLQPRHQCQRLSQIFPCDPDNDRGEREGYI